MGYQDVLYGYPYLEHLIQLWLGDWVKQMSEINKSVGENNHIDRLGGKRHLVCCFSKN